MKIDDRLIIGEVTDKDSLNNDAHIFIVNHRGILVELYTLFGHAFVGGGYGRSIHSVLEPYLADCVVYCGPKTYRSTEFDVIQNDGPEKVHVVNSSSSFYTVLKDNKNVELSEDQKLKDRLNEQFQFHYKIFNP